jgi:hypothetical protein
MTATRIVTHAVAGVCQGMDPADAFFAACSAIASSSGAQERAFNTFVSMIERVAKQRAETRDAA